MSRVIVAGHVNWDVTLCVDRLPKPDGEARIEDQHHGGGGSAANVAAGLANLGYSVGLIGSVGTDDIGDDLCQTLSKQGINIDGLRRVDGKTTVKYLLVADSGEVAVLGNDGVNEALSPEEITPERIRQADHLHVTNHRPETLATLTKHAENAGLSISVDLGRRSADREFTATLKRADIVFGSHHELTALFGTPEAGVKTDRSIVCTRGADGATVYTAEDSYTHPGVSTAVIDTSGAGDAFVAGFLYTWLAEGDYETALAVGNACGAQASTTRGAQSQLDPKAVTAMLKCSTPLDR